MTIVLIQSLQDFSYMAFKGLVYVYCLHPESHHMESESFETFYTPSNHWVLIK